MDLLNSFVYFIENILSIRIGLSNITILDLFIYLLFISSVLMFLKISIKGKNR